MSDNAAGVRAVLARALTEATLRNESATMEFNAITGDIPSSIPQPDGTQRIHNASHALSAALNDYRERGIVPDDLKRSD